MTNARCFPRTKRVLAGEVSPSKPHQPHSTGLRLSVLRRTELTKPQSVSVGQVDKDISEIFRVVIQIHWSECKGRWQRQRQGLGE